MSKETYLKGEQKLQAIQIIKTGLGIKMSTKEILQQLAKKGIEMSDRNLRRLKLKIYNDAGTSAVEIYRSQVGGKLFDQILIYDEMERRCWELYYDSKTPSEKFRALSQLRMILQDRQRILKNYTVVPRGAKIDYTKIHDDFKELHEEGDSETPDS